MPHDVPSFVRSQGDVARWRACLDVAEQLFGIEDEGLVLAGTRPARIRLREAVVGAAIVLFNAHPPDDEASEGSQRPRAGHGDADRGLRD